MDLEKRMLADERKFSRQDQEQMPLVSSESCPSLSFGVAPTDLLDRVVVCTEDSWQCKTRPCKAKVSNLCTGVLRAVVCTRFPAVEPGNLLRTVPRISRLQASPGEYIQTGQRLMSPQQGTYDHGGGGLFGMATGARVKVMRHILFGLPQRRQRRTIIEEEESRMGGMDRHVYEERPRNRRLGYRDPILNREPDLAAAAQSIKSALGENFRQREMPLFDFGVGLNLELDEGALRPAARLKVKDFFSIKLFPEPMFKIQKRIRLGPSSLGVRVNYELPLVGAENFWAPPARLMVRVDNHMGGFRLSPGGADFDEHVVQLGDNTSVRAAASVDFPKSLPLEEGDRFFSWRIRRLGIKTRW